MSTATTTGVGEGGDRESYTATTPLLTTPPISARRRIVDVPTTPIDLEAQHIQVAAHDRLTTLIQEPTRPARPDVLRVSPFVFFIIPVIFFYISAVLASYTLHFSASAESCANRLHSFLWGAIILGYTFVLGFAWLIVGPRIESLKWKWGGILIYTILLGILTGMGAKELIDERDIDSCTSTAWYQTCWVITVFYCVFWILLFILASYEVARSLCCPIPGRVIILGIGAGFNKLHLKPLKDQHLFQSITHKFPKLDVDNILTKRKTKPTVTTPKRLDGRQRAEIELAELEARTTKTMASEEVKKDNFFGSDATEKRRSLEKDRALDDAPPRLDRPSSYANLKVSSVAPSPEASDEEDTPTKRRRKRDERLKAEAVNSAAGELDQFRQTTAKPTKQFQFHDPLLEPTPQKKQTLPPLNTNKVGHISDDDDDDDRDPFAAKIAANKAAQEARRRELAEINRAHELLLNSNQPLSTIPLQPVSLITGLTPATTPGIWDPSSVRIDIPPTPGPTGPVSGTGTQPIGILKPPNSTTNTFKMVDFPSESRLEQIHHVPEESKYDESINSSMQMTDRSDGTTIGAGSHSDGAPWNTHPSSHHDNLGSVVYAAPPPPPPPPPAANSYNSIASPSSTASGSPMPLPNQSSLLPVSSPLVGPYSASDPNRFSKLFQAQQAQKQQLQQGQPFPNRVWPPPPPPLPSQSSTPAILSPSITGPSASPLPPTNPIRYHAIMDDDRY